jgi:predicted nucleic acid-binding protein
VACPRWTQEVRGVSGRPEDRRYFSLAEAEGLIAAALSVAEVLPDPSFAGALTRDPDDDYLVALALEAGCDAIVSGDRHLLDFAGPPAVWTPRELLERLEAGAP